MIGAICFLLGYIGIGVVATGLFIGIECRLDPMVEGRHLRPYWGVFLLLWPFFLVASVIMMSRSFLAKPIFVIASRIAGRRL